MRLDSSLNIALNEQGCLRYPGPKTGYRRVLGLTLVCNQKKRKWVCYVAAAWPTEKAPRPAADVYWVSLSVLEGQLKRSAGLRKIKRVTGALTHVGQRFWVGRAKKVTRVDISVHVDITWTTDVDKTTQAIQDTGQPAYTSDTRNTRGTRVSSVQGGYKPPRIYSN